MATVFPTWGGKELLMCQQIGAETAAIRSASVLINPSDKANTINSAHYKASV